MPKFKFAKLVRDKIVEHQLAAGAKPSFRRLGAQEHKKELVNKIAEEAHEIVQAKPEEVAAEIADVQQAVDDLKVLYGVTTTDVIKAQDAKNAKNGAFKKGLFIDYVEVAEDDPWAAYYRKNADRYPAAMTNLEIAKHYFELSNQSDFAKIAALFADSTTYSSQNTGVYLGKDDIIAMQKAFHGKFSSLLWRVNSVEEVKPGVILFDYDFRAKTGTGEQVESSGLEYVIIYADKIQHIEIRNKPTEG